MIAIERFHLIEHIRAIVRTLEMIERHLLL